MSFLQAEGEDLCVYRRDLDEEIHFVCRVDLVQREKSLSGQMSKTNSKISVMLMI